ncbi:MAG: molybdenum cofactor biosynthesis protein MoaE [Alphaproteobacteria bacterium]
MISVQEADFDAGALIAGLTAGKTHVGGVACFLGLVRDLAKDARVTAMTLEHYPGMTEKAIAAIVAEAEARWPLDGVVVVHRYGRLLPGDRIVLVATASAHRDAAFESARFLMDWLKTKAPFWKREETPNGDHWVEARTEDDAAADRWSAPAPRAAE